MLREVLGEEKPIGEPVGNMFVAKMVLDYMTSIGMISYLLVKHNVDGAFSALRHL